MVVDPPPVIHADLRFAVHNPKQWCRLSNVPARVTEFSPSFDRFDRAILGGGLLFVGTAGALQSSAALAAGAAWVGIHGVRWVMRLDLAGHLKRMAELRAEAQRKAREAVEKAMKEANEKVAAASRLTDEQLWLRSWQNAPSAFWLCPDLFKPDGSIDWAAVDRGPPPKPPEPISIPRPDPNRIEKAVREAAKGVRGLPGVTGPAGVPMRSLRLPDTITAYRHNPATDHFEVVYFDGRKKTLDRVLVNSLSDAQLMAMLDYEKSIAEQDEIRDITRKLRQAVYKPEIGLVERDVIHAGKSILYTEDFETGEMVKINLSNPTIEEARRYARIAMLEGYQHLWDDSDDDFD